MLHNLYPESQREIRLLSKSRDQLRDENRELKQQAEQNKTKQQQLKYLFEIFASKYGYTGTYL